MTWSSGLAALEGAKPGVELEAGRATWVWAATNLSRSRAMSSVRRWPEVVLMSMGLMVSRGRGGGKPVAPGESREGVWLSALSCES